MGCCPRPSLPPQRFRGSILPRGLILPLRLLVVAGFAASILFIGLRRTEQLDALHLLILFLQLLLSFIILGECRKSERFYRRPQGPGGSPGTD